MYSEIDRLQVSPSDLPTTPARLHFQRDKQADTMTTCSDTFLTLMDMRHLTTGFASPSLAQHILSRPEKSCQSMSMPSTPLRHSGLSSPSCVQHISRVYYAASWVEQQLCSSPSPLPKDPFLPGCDLSPPIHNAEGTPFDRHFNLSQSWYSSDPDISPIARRTSDDNAISSLHEGGNECHRFSGGSRFATSWSLMEKLPSLNASGPPTSSGCTSTPVMHASERSWSPVSFLSALTPLSSPERTLSVTAHDGWSCAPSLTSPIIERNTIPSRHSKDKPETNSASRRPLSTASHVFSVRSRKRPPPQEELPSGQIKHARTDGDSTVVSVISQTLKTQSFGIPSQRRLPPEVSRHPDFSLLYRRYPISSFFQVDDEDAFPLNCDKHPGGIYNSPRDPRDLYTPRFVKGKGRCKVGLCPICIESPSRGGRGQKIWLSTKFSAFNYHMQFAHGVSAMSGRPFSPPVSYRTTIRRQPLKIERSEIIEGKCHKCKKWVPMESIKDCEVKVKELFWWKHAATCHHGAQVAGDDDFYEQDEVSYLLEELGL